MATFIEVKGQQRSNIVDNDLWQPNLVRRFADTSLGWLWPSQRSKVSKGHNNKQFSTATKLGQKSNWCKLRMTVTFMEVKGQQRSNTVNNKCTPYIYLASRWGLGPKVCMHHFGCGMNWIKGYYMIVKKKKWNCLIFNFFNGNASLNIVIL